MGQDGYPGTGQMMFKDYHKFISDVQEAINDEYGAVIFYGDLMKKAPCPEARMFIKHARDDEEKHYRMLCRLYYALTGQAPEVKPPTVPEYGFCKGVMEALKDELMAAEMYREMLLSTTDMRIRDILFEIMTDETEHATRFTFVYSLADCEDEKCEIQK